MIMGINFVQAQNEIDTTDSFAKLVNEAAKSFKPIKIYTGKVGRNCRAALIALDKGRSDLGKA